jgi:hypothetical protein
MSPVVELKYVRSKRRAQEAANETFNDCLMSQLQDGKAAEDSDDFGFYRPSILDVELKAGLAAIIADATMSPAEYLDCVRAAADEANWIYDVVLGNELAQPIRTKGGVQHDPQPWD